MISSFTGELAALGGALLWATSSVVYGLLGPKISPLRLNLLKGIIAIALISITLLFSKQTLGNVNSVAGMVLISSGAIGIGLGDTAYFTALNYLGARRTLLLETLAPPLAGVIALIFLGENISLIAWCGILVTIIGVGWVITERTPGTIINSNHITQGIIWGSLAALSQAVGAVLSRFALVESNLSPLVTTLVRLIGGTMIVCCLLTVLRRQNSPTSQPLTLKLIGVIGATAIGSTYLGIWLQQISLKFAPAGIAQTLSATSPLFVLPLAFFMGEKISYRAILGSIIAIIGISILLTWR